MTFHQVRNRYIFGFGGEDSIFNTPDRSLERILRLDTSKPTLKWTSISLSNSSLQNGIQYGVMLLKSDDENVELLIYGGLCSQ